MTHGKNGFSGKSSRLMEIARRVIPRLSKRGLNERANARQDHTGRNHHPGDVTFMHADRLFSMGRRTPMNHDTFERVKGAGDFVAAGLTVGVVTSIIPTVAGFLTIIWTLIRISETERFAQFMRWLREPK